MSNRFGYRTRPGSSTKDWMSGFFTPAQLAPELWLDAADTASITESSGRVSQWNDKSGNGRHAVQASATPQPVTNATTQNGLNVIDFASNRYLTSSTASTWKFLHDGTTVYAAYLAYKYTSGNVPFATGRFVGGTIGLVYVQSNSGQTIQFYIHNGTAVVVNETQATLTGRGLAGNIFGAIMDPANATAALRSKRRANGVETAGINTGTATPSASDPNGTLIIGNDPASDRGMTGSIYEMVIWKSPTTEQCQLLETYLNKKWAIY